MYIYISKEDFVMTYTLCLNILIYLFKYQVLIHTLQWGLIFTLDMLCIKVAFLAYI